MDATPTQDDLWSRVDWVPAADRRASRSHTLSLLVPLFVGAGFLFSGLVIQAGGSADMTASTIIILLGVAVLIATALRAWFTSPYRRIVSEKSPTTVFHISSAVWEEGQTVTLIAGYSRGRVLLPDASRPRRVPVVFFFPHRPTRVHARNQTLSGTRHTRRYLYELKVLSPIQEIHGCGEARATPTDIPVQVLRRQDLGDR